MANTLKFGNGQWATKYGSTLAYNDENGNFKPLPFLFERRGNATRVNKEGLIEIVGEKIPRIDYKDSTDGALLLEPERTNLILQSQAISLSPTQNGTFVDNFAISPDGTQNATKLTATDTDPFFYQSVSFSADSYTASIYVKGIGNSIGKDFQIRLGVSGSAQIEIPSEWTRFEYTATMTSGSVICGIEIPNPAVIGDEVLVWGWQIEQGSYATSIINTNGSAATRLADSCSQTPPDGVIGETEGTIFVEYSNINFNGTSYLQSLDNGTSSERIELFVYNGNISISVRDNNVQQVNFISNISASGNNKIAFAYKLNDFVLYINGNQISSDNSGTIPSINKYNAYGRYDGAIGDMSNLLKSSSLYNTRLSNSELAALTQV